MTNKDFTRLFYFIFSNKEMSIELRWQLMALMVYITVCGVYDDESRQKPFVLYYSRLKEIFWIDKIDFFTLGDVYGFLEYEEVNSNAVNVLIKWEKIEIYRQEICNKQKQIPNQDTINQVIQMIKEGKVPNYFFKDK